MIGKKNIVFGFFYLVFSAALGPYMVVTQFEAVGEAQARRGQTLSALQDIASNGYVDEELNDMTGKQIAISNTGALLALSANLNSRNTIEAIKSGPHSHGNLEALLNIVVGLVICFLAVSVRFKQAISWTFIAGTLLHSGVLYLAVALQIPLAGAFLASPVAIIGPLLVLAGLFMIGVAALKGFQGEIIRD
ncbi:MAG: hypothetical protein V3S12_03870 [Acidiferrobacterales bacterium]